MWKNFFPESNPWLPPFFAGFERVIDTWRMRLCISRDTWTLIHRVLHSIHSRIHSLFIPSSFCLRLIIKIFITFLFIHQTLHRVLHLSFTHPFIHHSLPPVFVYVSSKYSSRPHSFIPFVSTSSRYSPRPSLFIHSPTHSSFTPSSFILTSLAKYSSRSTFFINFSSHSLFIPLCLQLIKIFTTFYTLHSLIHSLFIHSSGPAFVYTSSKSSSTRI